MSGIINDFLNIFYAERFDRNLAIVVNMLDRRISCKQWNAHNAFLQLFNSSSLKTNLEFGAYSKFSRERTC